MTRLTAAAVVLLVSHTTGFAYTLYQYDGARTKRLGDYTYPVLARIANDPVWEESDDPWVFVDTTNIRAMTGSHDFEFFLGSYTSDGPFQANQADAVESAIDEWDTRLGSDLSVTWGGVDLNLEQDPADTVNTIVFSDLDDLRNNVGHALIKVLEYRDDAGEILEVDILLNEDYDWTTDTHKCPVTTGGQVDIQSVVTHELGHALGIDHPYSAFTGCPTMLAGDTSGSGSCGNCASDTEALGLRTIEADDTDALDEIYGSGGADSKSIVSEEGGDMSPKRVAAGTSAGRPAALALESISPNPFNPSTTITFTLPEEGAARIEVHSITGQMVRVMSTEVLPAGRHQIEWDGHDADMREAASGVYLVVLIAGGARDYKKVTHLR
ncbi:MAG: T9SS type A sorting domain-containing protein [Gemmatimonadaceae bacterium]|nr:T9SS type A sorting domain-containing protein [Gemmatimonadaceae bacterium]